MTPMRNSIIVAAALLAAAPDMARAAEPPCLTAAELSNLATYALPSAIGGASERCAPALGSGAYLPTSGGELARRYEAKREASWPAARSAFLKLSAKSDGRANGLLKSLPDETLQDMLDLMVEGLVSQEIPTEKCGTIDQFARLLSPLPPENTAELIVLIAGLVGDAKRDGSGRAAIGKLSICQD